MAGQDMNTNASSPWTPWLGVLHQELRYVQAIAGQAALKIHHLEEEISRLETATAIGESPQAPHEPQSLARC